MTEVADRARLVFWCVVMLGLVVAAVAYGQASAGSGATRAPMTASLVLDDDIILPSRVNAALGRTLSALDRSEAKVDDQQYGSAASSLEAIDANLVRVHRAARAQMKAPVDPEAETTAGPDSVLTVLALDQEAITRLAGLYDTVTDPVVLNRFAEALNTALTKRNQLLDKVIKLNPEGAGAPYADGMADSVDGYADEVANLTEALAVDHLATSARAALTNVLSRSEAAAAKVTAAFGGGE
jgi:hypothetical protein